MLGESFVVLFFLPLFVIVVQSGRRVVYVTAEDSRRNVAFQCITGCRANNNVVLAIFTFSLISVYTNIFSFSSLVVFHTIYV